MCDVFNDEPVLHTALKAFKAECKEEILPDGMHFELSPMYHKLIFEGVVRVVVALKDKGLMTAKSMAIFSRCWMLRGLWRKD